MCLRQSKLGSTYNEHCPDGCQVRMVGGDEEDVLALPMMGAMICRTHEAVIQLYTQAYSDPSVRTDKT